MEIKKQGGKRNGAGRKPSGNPKIPITIYVPKKDIWLFGNEDKLRSKIYDFVNNYSKGEEPKYEIVPRETVVIYDAPKLPNNFQDEPRQWQEPKKQTILRSAEQWHQLKRACESIEEWNEVKQQIMDAPNLSQKQIQIIINTP